jgi:NDP-4-keto-2,6-dideoxyhexose 3-C-methyltransferase
MTNSPSPSYKEISKCRICGNPNLTDVLSLGSQCLSGVFPSFDSPDPSVSPLELVLCDGDESSDICRLLQFKHSANVSEMYGTTYGYRSSTSRTMRSHLEAKVKQLLEFVKPEAGDLVLDIGCNDGTLLNFYRGRDLVRVGIDPSSQKFIENFDSDIQVIFDFFSADRVREIIGDRKCSIVTSIAMFYDLEDPLDFMRQIHSILAPNGVWGFELSYMPMMFTNLTYDQVCHEHLTYIGLQQIIWMADRADLKILDVSLNDMNGGSFYIWAARKDSSLIPNHTTIKKLLDYEEPLKTFAPYERFRNRVLNHRDDVRAFFQMAADAGKKVCGYGASTKGNIVLNFCGITPKDMVAVRDMQEQKHGLVTPGTRIPIISQEEMRAMQPDYLFVLIWHFRHEVIEDEIEYLEKGGKLVFDLPRLHIVDRDNYKRYLNAPFEELAYPL